jgi:hypothetical protein
MMPPDIDTPIDNQFGDLLDQLGKLEPELPKDISIPALGGDPAAELPGAEPEPVYAATRRANIQGDIIPGFNKDHQHFLFFRLGDLEQEKQWLRCGLQSALQQLARQDAARATGQISLHAPYWMLAGETYPCMISAV